MARYRRFALHIETGRAFRKFHDSAQQNLAGPGTSIGLVTCDAMRPTGDEISMRLAAERGILGRRQKSPIQASLDSCVGTDSGAAIQRTQ
jgi:hypothetical protein